MAKKPQFTAEQLANDPSLKWCHYRQWEMVWSDVHQTEVRFIRVEGDKVRVASLNSIAELPELVTMLQIRRPSVMDSKAKPNWVPVRLRTDEGETWVALSRTTCQKVKCASKSEAEQYCFKQMEATR